MVAQEVQIVAEWTLVATTDGVFDLGQALSRAALTAAIAVFTFHKVTVPTGLNEKLQSINLNPFNSNGKHEATEKNDPSVIG
jgi:hypothetical protein